MVDVPIDKEKKGGERSPADQDRSSSVKVQSAGDPMEQSEAIEHRWLVIYLVVLPLLLLYLLILILPLNPVKDGGMPSFDLFLFFGSVTISRETQLLLIAVLAGGLGSYIHAVTSLTSYVGNRTLRNSWKLWYYMRPIMGSVLALTFYFLVIGGFLLMVVGTTNTAESNAYGIAALSSLVGMFSKQAIDKMREVFDSLFKASGDDERTDKLEDKRFVEQEMIRRSEIAGYQLKDDSPDTLRSIKIKDLSRLVGTRVTRVPIFSPDGSLICVLHKSMIHEYMAKAAIEAADANPPLAADYDHLTLADVLDSDKDRETIRESVAFVAPGSTIGEARAAMQRIEGCQDVFVTERGDRIGKVIGWLTNGIITRAIASG
jgi:hypothetical protein